MKWSMDEAYDAKEFGLAIRQARRARGWTQADLASWLGVSRPTVVKLEAGGAVSLPVAMRALAMLGAKAVIVRKGQIVTAADGGA
jgi:DNA-binding XRE family transcriptional regulator